MTYDQVRRWTIDYIFVIASVAAMVAVRAAVDPLLKDKAPLILFLLPVATAAWFGGFWPGLVATLGGGTLGMCLFASGGGNFAPFTIYNQWLTRGIPFLLVGACISFLADKLEKARLQALRGQAELHRSEERQRQIFESAKDFAIFTLSPAGIVTDWNAGAEQMFGYDRAEIIGHTADVLWTPEDRAAERPKIERDKAATDQGVEDRRWHLRKNGTRFFANGTMRPVHDQSGRITGMVKICRDDTARVVGDQERAHLAEQRRLALDAAQLGWWQHDPTTGQLMLDEGFGRIFGIAPGTRPSGEIESLIHPDDREKVSSAAQTTFSTDPPAPFNVEYRIRRPDGLERWIAATGRAYVEGQASDRHVVSFVGTVADVTEAKAAVDALAASEAAFRELADAMPQIVFAATPDGHVDYFNRQWYEYTGLPPGHVGFESWRHVHTEEGLQRVAETWPAALANGTTYEIEYALRRHDGQYRWHLGRALPVRDAEGRIVRWFGTNTDIHDQKRLQQEAEAARIAAEEAGRMKDEFLATISHELRTPLSAIVGWSHLLEENRQDQEMLDEGLSVIYRNAQAQSQLIEDILDVSRITTGKLRLHPKRVDLREPIEAALATVHTAADAKGVKLTVDLAEHVVVHGDADRLQQVFWNLMSNAIKFSPSNSEVTVRLWTEGGSSIVTVTDNGRGIAADFLPYVFERFRQADMTTTRRHGGLGLGLAIVRHLVDLHGGQVSADSEGEGRGSAFRVELPYQATIAADAPLPASASVAIDTDANVALAGRRVLVLEDEADTRRVLETVLRRGGLQVTAVERVGDAMAVLMGGESFDAIVSDIGLPEEDGYVFIRRLRSFETERRRPRQPVVALTAYARASDRNAVLAAGFDRFVAKPVRPTELLATLAGVMQAAER